MNILAINPWIYDFAAYDFWLKPYGFLVILTYLKNKRKDINLEYIDCLKVKKKGDYGRGKYFSEIVPKPAILKNIPRYFKRYGISLEEFREKIKNKKFDFILLTSSMTYWYPGIVEAVNILREFFPNVPIILGGTYASLCYRHAKKVSRADFVFKANQLKDFFNLLGVEYDLKEFFSTLPDYQSFYPQLDYVVFRTSWGCPFNCSYCAIKKLSRGFFRLPLEKVLNFILEYSQKGIKDFVFYDDALLYQPSFARNFLKTIKKHRLSLRFHTPNALHLKFLDEELACLLKETGFVNPHFGLEIVNPHLQKQWSDKANLEDLMRAIRNLKKAGFKKGEFSLYLLLGYPAQNLEELKKEALFLHKLGAKVSLAEFSLVPGTKLYKEYQKGFSEPLFQNNSLFSFLKDENVERIFEIKNFVRELNKSLAT